MDKMKQRCNMELHKAVIHMRAQPNEGVSNKNMARTKRILKASTSMTVMFRGKQQNGSGICRSDHKGNDRIFMQ